MAENTIASWLLTAFKGFCAAVIFISTLLTFYTAGPWLETRYWPAVTKLEIISLVPNDDATALITVRFTKLRGECEYRGISWFRGKENRGLWFWGKENEEFERVPVILLRKEGDTSSPNRPVGTQISGPWIIGMPAEEIRENSFAKVYHQCWPFWTSVSEFWP